MNAISASHPKTLEKPHEAIEDYMVELRIKEFQKIVAYRTMMLRGGFTKRTNLALFGAFAVFAAAHGAGWLASQFALEVPWGVIQPLAIICFLATWVLILYITPVESHAENMDRLLAAYKPFNVQAYRDYQQRVAESGSLFGESLTDWLAAESAAINIMNARGTFQFLHRDLPQHDEPAERSVHSQWVDQAYPLQQLTIRLQGTRHSDSAAIIAQLELIAARLKAGDKLGSEHDDDFGYAFEYVDASPGPSFFNNPAGRA